MERNEHQLGAIDVAYDKTKELMAVVCSVRDLPHLLAAGVPRPWSRRRGWWLKHDPLLMLPEHSQQQQIDNGRYQHNEPEHVMRNAEEPATVAGFLTSAEECNLPGC